LLACVGHGPELWLCEPDPDKPHWKALRGHDGRVTSAAFGNGSKGEALLASGGSDGTVRLWGPDDGRSVREPLIAHKHVNAVAFGTGAGRRVLLASGGSDETDDRDVLFDGCVRLWDPDNGTPIGEPLSGEGEVHSLAFGPCAGGRMLLAAGGYDWLWL
jgi:WD40 repeat protein